MENGNVTVKLIPSKNAIGTSYRGRIPAISFETICNVLGSPNVVGSEDDKVSFSWVMKVGGIVVTLYDYKGDRWHFGGHGGRMRDVTNRACALVAEMLGTKFEAGKF